MFLLFAFSLGIVLSILISPSLTLIVFNFALLLIIKKDHNLMLVSLTKALFIFQIGLFCGSQTIPHKPDSLLLARVKNEDKKTPFWIEGKIVSSEKTLTGSKAVIKTDAFYDGDNKIKDNIKIITYLPINPPNPLSRFKGCLFLSLPKTKTNPGQFDYRKSLNEKGIFLSGELKDKSLFEITQENLFPKILSRYKNNLRDQIIEKCGNKSGIVLSLLLGERGLLNQKERLALVRSGLFHLIALSGLHIGIIVLIFYFFLNSLSVNPFTTDLTLLLFLSFYFLIVKDQPSVVRAILMAFVFIIARMLCRQSTPLNSLLISFTVILAFNPYQIKNAGFELTFLATLGIITLYKSKWQIFKESSFFDYIFTLFWVGFSAQLFTLPVTIYSFNRISPLSFLFTPIASLFLFPFLTFGLIYIFGGSLIPFLNSLLLLLVKFFAKCFLVVAFYTSKINISSLFFPLPHFIYALLFTLSLVLIVLVKREKKWLYALVLLILVTISYYFPDPFNTIQKDCLITLDVGQGNCALLHLKGKNYLIDCADTSYHSVPTSRSIIEPFLSFMKIKKIDGIFISHWDKDHSGSLKEIVSDLKTNFVASPRCLSFPSDIEELLSKKKIKMVSLERGDIVDLKKTKVEVLHPGCDSENLFSENNLSLVFSILINNKNLLITGDIEKEGQKEIYKLQKAYLKRVDILMAPHHGAKNSLFTPFIREISPKVVLFSVGKNNRFNHPHKSVLNYYNAINSKIFRTDKNGAILLIVDEKKIVPFTYSSHPWEKNLFK